MSIDDPRVIDIVAVKPELGPVVLIISDHWDWCDEGGHLLALQEKLNSYLNYIESGQIDRGYPDARERGIRIEIVAKNSAPPTAGHFFQHVDDALQKLGIEFEYKHFNERFRGADEAA